MGGAKGRAQLPRRFGAIIDDVTTTVGMLLRQDTALCCNFAIDIARRSQGVWNLQGFHVGRGLDARGPEWRLFTCQSRIRCSCDTSLYFRSTSSVPTLPTKPRSVSCSPGQECVVRSQGCAQRGFPDVEFRHPRKRHRPPSRRVAAGRPG